MTTLQRETKFDFDDVLIKPAVITDIKSRYNDINPYYGQQLPIITAPMDSVINGDNANDYLENRIMTCLPRTVDIKDIEGRGILNKSLVSYGLSEFKELLNGVPPQYILIDVANGHMKEIGEAINAHKEKFPKSNIWAGNIANPETYVYYAMNTQVDGLRIGIGNGNGCLTTQQTGIGFPKASLIRECYEASLQLPKEVKRPLIVADGGMKDYSDIIKALALGADIVMVGSIFNKAIESAGKNYVFGMPVSPQMAEDAFRWGLPVKKQFYGMSTKKAQKKMGKTNLKTSEGVVKYRKVEYSLEKWVENFEHYLRTAMSYTNKKSLNEFVGKVEIEYITENAFRRFNK